MTVELLTPLDLAVLTGMSVRWCRQSYPHWTRPGRRRLVTTRSHFEAWWAGRAVDRPLGVTTPENGK